MAQLQLQQLVIVQHVNNAFHQNIVKWFTSLLDLDIIVGF